MLKSTAVRNALLIVRDEILKLKENDDVIGIYIDANWPNMPNSKDCFDISGTEGLKYTVSYLKDIRNSVAAKYAKQIAESPFITISIVHNRKTTQINDGYNEIKFTKKEISALGNIWLVYIHTKISDYNLRYHEKGRRCCLSLARGIIIYDKQGVLTNTQILIRKDDLIKRTMQGKVEPQKNSFNRRLTHEIRRPNYFTE